VGADVGCGYDMRQVVRYHEKPMIGEEENGKGARDGGIYGPGGGHGAHVGGRGFG
jgi:hypothetical protein